MKKASLMQELLRTIDYAAQQHATQRRKNSIVESEKVAYINHPISVTNTLANLGGVDDLTILQGAVLHDVVEDTAGTLAEIEKLFGPAVAEIVKDVTDDKSLPKVDRKKQQIVHVPHACHGAQLVKLSDKLDNLKSLLVAPPPAWSKERIQGYFVWAWFVVESIITINKGLREALLEVFNSSFTIDGETHPCLPGTTREEREELLQKYYTLLTRS